jgi:predicted RNase H-related nuclease YkuK (DUF458 family)
MNKKFMNNKREHVGDPASYIKEYIKNHPEYEYKIYIGCDSQVNRKSTVYSTVIGIHRIGHGVHIIHTREYEKKTSEKFGDIINRLWKEVTRIVDTALYLKEQGIDIDDIGTHVDANGDNKYVSNKIYASAIGWLNGLGFKVEGKPNAWAATYAANRYCR